MSQPLTPTERLLALADKHKLTAREQLELLRGIYHDGTQGIASLLPQEFNHLIDILDEELAATRSPKPPKEPEPPPTAMTAGSGVAEMSTFFDRNLARHSLAKLVQLPSDGAAFERVGYDTARLVVPRSEMATYKAILDRGLNFEAAESEIIAGWYTIFNDGSTAAIAIVNARAEVGGAYVDAFLILPDGIHPTVPNVSLLPTRRLDGDFVFSYPDGTYKVIRLVPSTV